ncbi:MAG: NUDIX hydrolase [Firmicutes bacterium]|nr:NUDIX hydrolase [Bacillota bacterium]
MQIIVNVVIEKEGKVLMVQENWGKFVGVWNFPAGRLDENEGVFAAAIREAKEETGYDVELTGVLDIQNCVYPDRHVIHIIFTAKIIGGEIKFDPKEIMDVKFIEIKKLLGMGDKELRSSICRKATIQRLADKKVFPLEIVRDFKI